MSETRQVSTLIDSVSVDVQAGGTVRLQVSGNHPDGCDYPVQITQNRNANNLSIEIYREIPMEVGCPMMMTPYSETITVDDKLDSGDYSLQINNYQGDFSVS